MSVITWLNRLLAPATRPSGLPSVDAASASPQATPSFASAMDHDVPLPKEPTFSTKQMRNRIFQAFDVGMPVDSRAGLSGRQAEVDQLWDGVVDQNKHGIIFGPRGSGKTSLSRVFGDLADEARNIVLYQSASGDTGFVELMRPYIQDLSGLFQSMARDPRTATMASQPFSARDVAMLMTDCVPTPTILILDEFDRITSEAAKHEVAGLMKLLSDTRCRVRLLIVGIAANLEDLIEGHPSLRRHLVSIPIGVISSDDIRALLEKCAQKAQLAFSDEAVELIVHSATGSPYHLRLFGMHAALTAYAEGSNVEASHVRRGMANALVEWSRLNRPAAQLLDDVASTPGADVEAIVTACAMAAIRVRFSEQELAHTISITTIQTGTDSAARARATLQVLAPLLLHSAHDSHLIFHDSLLPQFFMLKLCKIAQTVAAASETSADETMAAMIRASLHHED